MLDVTKQIKEPTKTKEGDALVQAYYNGMKCGIEALLKSCEEAYKRGMFSIDAVKIMVEQQISTLNIILEEECKC